MKKDGEMSSGEHASPPCPEASLDVAEELFVSCRFTEAARVCCDALGVSSVIVPRGGDATKRGPTQGLTSGVPFDDQVIAPVEECDTFDLIAAVLLQCGFELRRTEEWRRCCAFYDHRGAMPFAVGILWLRLRLAGGEFDLVRKVLWQLRSALREVLQQRAETSSSASGFGVGSSKVSATAIALANYSEAVEMLIVQIMLPSGESAEASALASNDAHLSAKDKMRLLKACELRTSEEQELSAVTGGAPDSVHSRSNQGHARGAATREVESNGHARYDNFERPPDEDTGQQGHQQQGSVLKLLSDVSNWAPEVPVQLVVGAGAAGLAAYAALRNRDYLWRAARSAAGVAARTAGDIGSFIVGTS